MKRLQVAISGVIDTSDIPEKRGKFSKLKKDENGTLPRRSMIREAVVQEMERLHYTSYRLWKEAKEHCPTLSQAAVHLELVRSKAKASKARGDIKGA